MPLPTGAKLGPYEIISPIGAGGMGEVYKARDTRLDRTVAIKVLKANLSNTAELRERFEREARTISNLNHPNICVLHDIGRHDGIDFLVMEYLEGDTLTRRLARGAMPLDEALKWAVEIAGALDKAHRQSVTHRDLKPGNIMLTKSGAKLLDFGLAKLRQEEAAPATPLSQLRTVDHALTAQGTLVGTLQYMARRGNEGKEYLLWQREGALVAQEFDLDTLKLKGKPSTIANQVATDEASGTMMTSVSDNGLLLYGSANTMGQLTWFDRNGKRLGAVGEPGQYQTFRLSPDGRIVAADRGRFGGSDLWLMDTERGVPRRFTSSNNANYWPVWSPDSRTIVFTSTESNLSRNAAGGTLFRKQASGTGDVERLTESKLLQISTDWSRDGKYLLYSDIAPNGAMWVLPVTLGGKPTGMPRLYLRSRFSQFDGRFEPQPNPRWVAYQSDESGRNEIYVDSFPEPGKKARISANGGVAPEWSPDGRELFYFSPDLKLMGARLKTESDAIQASTPLELFAPPIFNTTGYIPYLVAPNGRFLIRAVPEGQASQPLTLLSNWSSLLKRSAAN
jgi:Tol biopolymer transport system component/tRNA A-37 threonylcarbamoyl transferase component Bud32